MKAGYADPMMANPSRRTLIAAGIALTAAAVAGCTRALRADPSPTVNLGTSAAFTAPDTSSTVGSGTGTTQAGSSAAQSATPDTEPSPATVTTLAGPTTPGKPAIEIANGPRDRPQVALTFHGAGDVALARKILQIVNDRGAKITVMVVGTWLTNSPTIAAEILAGGHQLGNHTWSHQDINSMDEAAMTREVTRCRDLLVQTAGTPGGYFRPSQSQTANALLKQVAGAAGYPVSLSYDVDSMDWTDPGAAAVRRHTASAQPGSIVSMHLGHQDTIDALPAVLDDLAARGLTAVTAATLLA
jgi:peptidoglycan/xylan/chitin deacetylase (PgdA/CDA1 family)